MTVIHETQYATGSKASSLRWLRDRVTSFVKRRQEHQELRRLHELDDYLLKDIGLSRHDLYRAGIEPMSTEDATRFAGGGGPR